MAWQRGQITPAQVTRILGATQADCVNIAAMHHPLEQQPQVDKAVSGLEHALASFRFSQADKATYAAQP